MASESMSKKIIVTVVSTVIATMIIAAIGLGGGTGSGGGGGDTSPDPPDISPDPPPVQLTNTCSTPLGSCRTVDTAPPGTPCWCPDAYGQPVSGQAQ